MKVGIMQPYFLPYIGYFQLIASVDKFVIYDNIKYTKKGWINRNRMLQNGTDKIFSVALAKASDRLDIVERELSSDFNRQKLLSQFRGCYLKAPYFEDVWPLIERIVSFQDDNLFRYIQNSIVLICGYLDIDTEIIVSSSVVADHDLLSQDRVLSICEALNANTYVNPIGGVELYSSEDFAGVGYDLKFINTDTIEYAQFGSSFVPWLSILDVLMFNSKDQCKQLTFSRYEFK
jgi:hypothetical protein